jgi:aspartate 1-decarboxylase
MLIEVCISKIHRATVTQAKLNYIGSITIDRAILDACGMKAFQYVNITNVANGFFWRTYIMPGKRGRGDICLNGPPARHFQPGDKIIVLAQGWIDASELASIDPLVVLVTKKNKVKKVIHHGKIKQGHVKAGRRSK